MYVVGSKNQLILKMKISQTETFVLRTKNKKD